MDILLDQAECLHAAAHSRSNLQECDFEEDVLARQQCIMRVGQVARDLTSVMQSIA